ncbi:MAG: hypothetical protein KF721_11395 [Ignavibacteriaceae bacterium]|nr:hypothetical protein [Ignavibacteriaceae bacterium]
MQRSKLQIRWGYEGLKTYTPKNNPNNNKIIIRNYGPPQKPYTVTQEDMQYIKNLIETEIYPHIKEENKPPIEFKILTTPEPLITNPGETIIFPGTGYYITSFDDNGDAIIDKNYIELQRTQYQDSTMNGKKLQEILSAFYAPNQVINHQFKTVLSSGAETLKLTPMDIRLIEIGQHYPPKTNIDKILGME